MERQIKRLRRTGEELREKSEKLVGDLKELMSRRRDKDVQARSRVRLPALPLFGNVFQRATISISGDRQGHLSVTLQNVGRKAFAQRHRKHRKHRVPGECGLVSGSLELTCRLQVCLGGPGDLPDIVGLMGHVRSTPMVWETGSGAHGRLKVQLSLRGH